MMDFSVVIPVYNSSSYIKGALDSIVSYSGDRQYEVILVDDCSDDVSDLKTLISKYPCARLIEKPEKTNASDSRNIGLENAGSSYVFYLDSDDQILPGYIERRLKMLIEKSVSVIFGKYIMKINGQKIRSSIPNYSCGDPREYIFLNKGNCFSSTICVNKARLKGSHFDPDLDKHQDWGFIIDAYDRDEKIFFDGEPGILKCDCNPQKLSSGFNESASQYFVEKYLSKEKYVNGFAESHIIIALQQKNKDALEYYLSIYGSKNNFSVDVLKRYVYALLGSYPFRNIAPSMIGWVKKIKRIKRGSVIKV